MTRKQLTTDGGGWTEARGFSDGLDLRQKAIVKVTYPLMTVSLSQLLEEYRPRDADEKECAAKMRQFLSDCPPEAAFGRELAGEPAWWGHITGSAWIVNPGLDRVVLVHHAKLGKWLQPGGHSEGQSESLQVALREAREETSLPVEVLEPGIFDLDIHQIPEYWNTPAHFHYDVRFLLVVPDGVEPVVSDESHAVRWLTLDEAAALNPELSIARMIEKTRAKKNGTPKLGQ